MRALHYTALIVFLAQSLSGCNTLPVKPPPPTRQVLLQREEVAEELLLEELRRRYGIKRSSATAPRASIEIEVFLRKIAIKLIAGDPEIARRPIGVLLVDNSQFAFRSLAVPGNRIYLAKNLIQKSETESEWAAWIAFQLGHLIRHSLALRWDPQSVGMEWFSVGGLFAFETEDHQDAARKGTQLLYRGGYDPRGLTQIFKQLKENNEQNVWNSDTIERVLDAARQEQTRLSPLRNPIIRTNEFLGVQKWVQKL